MIPGTSRDGEDPWWAGSARPLSDNFRPTGGNPEPAQTKPAQDSVEKLFNDAAENIRKQKEKCAPALAAMAEDIGRIQQQYPGVGFTVATAAMLKELGVTNAILPYEPLVILHVYDSKFLLAIDQSDGQIRYYNNDLTKNSFSDKETRWYDMGKPTGRLEFMSAILSAVVPRVVVNDLRQQFDTPPEKPAQKQIVKHAIPAK